MHRVRRDVATLYKNNEVLHAHPDSYTVSAEAVRTTANGEEC